MISFYSFMPFHAAEQRSKMQTNDSAERSDFPRRLLFVSSTGAPAESRTSERLPFLLVRFLWANKENERIKNNTNTLCIVSFFCLPLCPVFKCAIEIAKKTNNITVPESTPTTPLQKFCCLSLLRQAGCLPYLFYPCAA